MLGKCFSAICIISIIFACFTGNIGNMANAILDGASRAVTLSFDLLGMMCLWCAILKVAEKSGAIEFLAKLLRPILKLIFPDAYKNGSITAITAAISANILGIGNAATPLAVNAMQKMQETNDTPDTATDDMVTFTVLGTASLDILPTTLLAMRRAAGSAEPYKIIIPIWICSACCAAFAVMLARGLCICGRLNRSKKT